VIYLNILGVTFGSNAEPSSKEGQLVYCRQKASVLQPAVRVLPTVIQAAIQTAAVYSCRGTGLLNSSVDICSK